MKKVFLAVPIILALSGCEGDIDLVKDGVMEFNQTITLGKALDNWRSCESREWEEFETDNGTKVVQFTCQHKLTQFINKTKNLLSQKDQAKTDHLNLASNIQTFQFTINQDDTFQIGIVQVQTTWTDGTSLKGYQPSIEQLEKAYGNNLKFDPTKLNKIVAEQISHMFLTMKSFAK